MRKNVFFFLAAGVCFIALCSIFCSCGNNNKSQKEIDDFVAEMRADRAEMEKYQLVHIRPETDVVKIHFKEGESPFFAVSMLTEKSNNVSIDFFRAEDITEDGMVKSGKTICRTFMIFLPGEEKINHWGYDGIDLIRSDYTVHHVSFELVDQPE